MDEKKVLQELATDLGQPMREKTWDECGIEEKVERLRGALVDLRWGVNHANERARHFESHQHDALGQIVVPLRDKSGYAEGRARDLLA